MSNRKPIALRPLPEEMMTPAEVARVLDVTPARVRAMDEQLVPKRLGGNRVYDPSVVERVRRERVKRGVQAK